MDNATTPTPMTIVSTATALIAINVDNSTTIAIPVYNRPAVCGVREMHCGTILIDISVRRLCVPLFLFPNVFSPVCYATTLHVIGSYCDPITCKVAAKNTCRMAIYWPCSALTYLLSAEHGQTPLSFFRKASWPFTMLILCMWSDRTMIQPYAKY
jgi:hypothetical protein